MLRSNTVKTEYGEAPLHESTSLSMRIVGTGKVIGLARLLHHAFGVGACVHDASMGEPTPSIGEF